MAKIKRGQYAKAAEEMQNYLGIDPPIDPKSPVPELSEALKKAAGLLHGGDVEELSDSTWEVLESLGFSKKKVAKVPEPDDAEPEAKESGENSVVEPGENELTAKDIQGMSRTVLVDLIEDKEFDIDEDDYETVEDLQLAVIDALGIEVPEKEREEEQQEEYEEELEMEQEEVEEKEKVEKEEKKDVKDEEKLKPKKAGKFKPTGKKPDKKGKEKKPEKKTEKSKEKDEFGFSLDSLDHIFIETIRNNPMTMNEIKKEKWNTKKRTFYNTWRTVVLIGKGKMSI